jgi:hypothetical protein
VKDLNTWQFRPRQHQIPFFVIQQQIPGLLLVIRGRFVIAKANVAMLERSVSPRDEEILPVRELLTWFWMRSLTRSIGAAAVFETAAETPPTVDIC